MAKKHAADKTKAPPTEHWGEEPDEHDYPAAEAYLSLLCTAAEVSQLVTALRAAPIQRQKAKDLLRASRLELLPVDNAHVATDLAKVNQGKPLSPVLLVRGDVDGIIGYRVGALDLYGGALVASEVGLAIRDFSGEPFVSRLRGAP